MTGTRKILLIVALLAAGGGAAWYFAKSGAPATGKKTQAPPVPVRLAKAVVQDMPLRLDITGRTEAYETVTLKSRVDGQVQGVTFTEGQHVRQGDLLLRLDPADFQAKLNQAEANLARSRAQSAKANADVERYIALRAKGFVSEEKVGEMRTAAAAAEAVARADAAAAELARLQLSYTVVKAPFAGVVGAKLVSPGAAVKVNDTTLAVVNRVRPLYVGFAVPEKYLPLLQAGMRSGKKSMKAAISVPGISVPWEADVRFLDNGVDVATGTIQLKAILPNEDERLAPGQFVSVSLVLDTLKDAVVIPAEAVQQGAEGSFLFVAKEDGTVDVRKIRVGAVQQRSAIVAEGLAGGESVVTEGHLRLTAGARIKPADGGPEGKGGKPGAPGGKDGKSGKPGGPGKPD
ncbi:MAG: efflux transporter RND family MFP subunit [Rhodocyclaceae bacterium]|nr:MAG: efflux transporter RND family MFP subunit [Rhodocyclaceae bacterium]TND05986.1 MAG: efflux transporter, RND family, MFP subunit [Rhodocyclaceae bacterium]